MKNPPLSAKSDMPVVTDKPALSDVAARIVREQTERIVPELVQEATGKIKEQLFEELLQRISTDDLLDELTTRNRPRQNYFGGLSRVGRIGSDAVDFTQSGTGAVSRTVSSKLQEGWVSITDFGGSVSASAATNTAALLAAAVEATNTHSDAGGVVYIPGNTSVYNFAPIDFSTLGHRVTLRGDSMRASRISISGGSTGAGTSALKFSLSGFSWAGIRDLHIAAASAYERVVWANAPANSFRFDAVRIDGGGLASYGLYVTGGSTIHLDEVYTTGCTSQNYFSKDQDNSTQWLIVGGNHDIATSGIMYVQSTNQGPNIYIYGGRFETCTNKNLFQFETTGGQLRIYGSMFTNGAATSLVKKVSGSTPIWHLDAQLTAEPTNIYVDAITPANTILYATGNNNALMLGPSSSLLVHAGAAATPAIAALGDSTNGFWSPAAGQWRFGDVIAFDGGAVALRLGSTMALAWGNASLLSNVTLNDLFLSRDAANTLAQKNGNADQFQRQYGMNNGYWERGSASELLTIAAAATTDTTGNLLPANAIIEAVNVRVTTVIPTAATFTVGDATIAARFATGVAVAAGTTAVGLTHVDQTGTSGPKQTAAAKVRITPNLVPGAATGVVRITVFYRSFVAPTS